MEPWTEVMVLLLAGLILLRLLMNKKGLTR